MDIEKLILAAQHHGEDGDSPDHEVGDLQDLLRACWAKMTPKAKTEVFSEFMDELEDWLREDADVVATHDYVVALDLSTGDPIAVWTGERFRSYEERTVHQYKIPMAKDAGDAVKRAQAMRVQLQAPKQKRSRKS